MVTKGQYLPMAKFVNISQEDEEVQENQAMGRSNALVTTPFEIMNIILIISSEFRH